MASPAGSEPEPSKKQPAAPTTMSPHQRVDSATLSPEPSKKEQAAASTMSPHRRVDSATLSPAGSEPEPSKKEQAAASTMSPHGRVDSATLSPAGSEPEPSKKEQAAASTMSPNRRVDSATLSPAGSEPESTKKLTAGASTLSPGSDLGPSKRPRATPNTLSPGSEAEPSKKHTTAPNTLSPGSDLAPTTVKRPRTGSNTMSPGSDGKTHRVHSNTMSPGSEPEPSKTHRTNSNTVSPVSDVDSVAKKRKANSMSPGSEKRGLNSNTNSPGSDPEGTSKQMSPMVGSKQISPLPGANSNTMSRGGTSDSEESVSKLTGSVSMHEGPSPAAWAERFDGEHDRNTRVVGWKDGVPVTSREVKGILKDDKHARHDYTLLEKAAKKKRFLDHLDPLNGTPPTFQAFWKSVPHLDAQGALRHFKKDGLPRSGQCTLSLNTFHEIDHAVITKRHDQKIKALRKPDSAAKEGVPPMATSIFDGRIRQHVENAADSDNVAAVLSRGVSESEQRTRARHDVLPPREQERNLNDLKSLAGNFHPVSKSAEIVELEERIKGLAKKLNDEKKIDADEEATSMRLLKEVADATYQLGKLKGMVRSSNAYFNFIRDDAFETQRKKGANLVKANALLQTRVKETMPDIKKLMDEHRKNALALIQGESGVSAGSASGGASSGGVASDQESAPRSPTTVDGDQP